MFVFLKDHLIRLQATGHTVLIDAAAAVGQAAFADVLSAAGGVDVAAAVDQQVFPLTDVSWKKSRDKKLFQSQQTDGSAAFTLASVRGDAGSHRARP